MPMHHAGDGLFFGRKDDRTVRVLKMDAPFDDPPDVNDHVVMPIIDITLSADAWRGVVYALGTSGGE